MAQVISPGTTTVGLQDPPRTATIEQAATSRALTTRYLDFWLLGGASILIWVVMVATQGFRASWAIDQHFKNLTITTASLSLLVNYPHFLVSYKLAYVRGRAFVLTHWWQLVAVPALLVALFAFAFAFYNVPTSRVPGMVWLAGALEGWGTNARLFSAPRFGDLMFTGAFNLMVFTVGWHYTKQVFGCMMVYAHFDRYALTRTQREITRWSLLTIWWLNFVYNNLAGSQNSFSQFTYYSLDLPDIAGPIAEFLVFGGFALTLYKVFYANYRDRAQLPSLNMVAPFIALYIWWLPQTRQNEFYFLLTPLFHSLQYLAFVYKVEDARLRSHPHRELQGTIIVAGLILAGWLAFEFIPNSVDNLLRTFNMWGMFFFFTAAMLFINIHHYFIDNVIWRLKDPDTRKYLLG